MNATAKIAAGVASGYLLGRTKKFKLAVTVGSALAGQRIATNPRGLMQQAQELIGNNPELAKLQEQITGDLVEAVKTVAVTQMSSGLASVNDSLRQQLEPPESSDEAEAESEEAEGEETEAESEEAGQPADEGADEQTAEPEEESPAPQSRNPRKSSSSSSSTQRSSAKKASPDQSGGAKKSGSAKKSDGAKKSTSKSSGTAKKSAAKKTASASSGTRGA